MSGRVQLKDNGRFAVVLAGITDEDGVPVTSDLSLRTGHVMTGDEYVLVLSGSLPSFGAMPFQVNLPIELVGGAGVAASVVSSMVRGIMGSEPFLIVERVDLYRPVGAQWAAECQASISDGGVIFAGAPNPCSQADRIGASGVRLRD